MEQAGARAALQRLWLSRCEQLLATLQLQEARTLNGVTTALLQLQGLCPFLADTAGAVREPDAGHALWLAEAAARAPGAELTRLVGLLQVQASLLGETPAGKAEAARQHLRRQLGQELLQIARACRGSEWTLAALVASGLAQQCHRATLLGRFCGDTSAVQQLEELELCLLVWHAAGHKPGNIELTVVQQQLLTLARRLLDDTPETAPGFGPGANAAACRAPTPGGAIDSPVPLDTLALAEIAQWRHRLHAALQPAAPPTEALMLAAYRLLWLLQACHCRQAADCGLLVYALLARHWQLLEPLPAPVHALLHTWQTLMPDASGTAATLPQASLLACLQAALRSWPERSSEQLPVLPLPGDSLQQGKVLPAAQMPEFMAAALHALLQVQSDWFIDRAAWQRSQALLLPELRLLERGAAALRLPVLESLASQLLGLHALLHLEQAPENAPAENWPGAALWQVHAELVALLDRTALWQEARISPVGQHTLLTAALQAEARLQALTEPTQQAPGSNGAQLLAIRLTLFVRQLGRLLGKEVHLHIDFKAPTAAQGNTLLPLLQELLRWLLLQAEHGTEWRRNQRLPLASTLQLCLQLPLPSSRPRPELEAILLEPEGRAALPARALRSLQRRLGPALRDVQCELLPEAGRQLRLLIAKD